MAKKGIGPQGLGTLGNNGYHIGSPAKVAPIAAIATKAAITSLMSSKNNGSSSGGNSYSSADLSKDFSTSSNSNESSPAKNLRRWFKEKWETPKGNEDYSKGENTFRPTVKVSRKTPKTWREVTPESKAKAQEEKNTKGRVTKY